MVFYCYKGAQNKLLTYDRSPHLHALTHERGATPHAESHMEKTSVPTADKLVGTYI